MCWDISHVFCAVSGQNTNITRFYVKVCWDISHVFCAFSGQNTNITKYYVKVDAAVTQIKFMSCPTLQLSLGLISCGIRCASHPDCIAFDITPSECLLCFFNINGLYNIQGELFHEKLPITSGKPYFYVTLISFLYAISVFLNSSFLFLLLELSDKEVNLMCRIKLTACES